MAAYGQASNSGAPPLKRGRVEAALSDYDIKNAAFHEDFPSKDLIDCEAAGGKLTEWLDRGLFQDKAALASWFDTHVPSFKPFEATVRDQELLTYNATSYIKARRAGQVTCVEYCQTLMRRAHFYKNLNCFTVRTLDSMTAILEQAKCLDQFVIENGNDVERIAPLYGLPIAVKDTICTVDFPTGFGTGLLADFRPGRDADLVAQIRARHGIIFGKTNSPEFAKSWHTCNHTNGCTRNPHDLSLTVGGSSGGSAVAVAARLCPIAISEDTGGSTRSPAFHVGTFGYDPPRGKYPNDGCCALTITNDQLGLNTRDFDDILLMDIALCGKVSEHESARVRMEQRKVVVAFPQVFFVSFTLPDSIASLPLAERSGLRSCRVAGSIRGKLQKARALLQECKDFVVSSAEWGSYDNRKFGRINVLYHMLFGFEYAEGRPLSLLTSMVPWQMLTQDVLHRFGPQPERSQIQDIMDDMRPIGSQHDPAGQIDEDEYALRYFAGPYTDQCIALWNAYFDDHAVDIICVPTQFCSTWSWKDFAGHRIGLEVLRDDGTYAEEHGSFTWQSNWILFFNKSLAIPKVAVPLGVDEVGRPVGCCIYGRAVPADKRYDIEYTKICDLEFLYQVRKVVSVLHADGSPLHRVEPAAARI